jgi:MFS family permease
MEKPLDRRRWCVVLLLFAAALMSYIDRGNTSVAAPVLMREFGYSPGAMGVLLSAFFWLYGLLQVPAGYAIDRFGLRWMYAGAFLLWSLCTAAMGIAGSFTQFLVLRLLLGTAESLMSPASLAYIKRAFRSDEQGLPTGVFTGGMVAGPAVGLMLGTALLDRFGWRVLFLATGLGGCAWIVPWLLLGPRGKHGATPTGPRAPRVRWAKVFRLPITWAIAIGSFFYSYHWYFCLTWLPSYLVMERGLSIPAMGGFAGLPLAGMALMTPVCGHLADRRIAAGRPALAVRRHFVCTGFVLGSSILLLRLNPPRAATFAILAASLAGLGVASANFWALTQTVCPASLIGRAIGYQNAISNFGGISAPLVTGWLVKRSGSFQAPILVTGLALWVAAAAFLFLARAPASFPVTADGYRSHEPAG